MPPPVGTVAMSQEDVEWQETVDRDNRLLQDLLAETIETGEGRPLFDATRPLDVGDKADDAEDYEDISDDDLPEEEFPDREFPEEGEEASGGIFGDGPGLTDDGGTSHDTDDLFGEGRGSSPFDEIDSHDVQIQSPAVVQSSQLSTSRLSFPSLDNAATFREINFHPEPKISASANQDLSIPPPAESAEDLLQASWPTFRKGTVINWNELLPPKKATYIGKVPLKTPKPVNPTKVALDMAADQEKIFRLSGSASSSKKQRLIDAEAKGIVPIIIEEQQSISDIEDFDFATPPPDERIGGITWADLEIVCDDWESKIDAEPLVLEKDTATVANDMDDEDAEWFRELGVNPAKRQKISNENSGSDILFAPNFPAPLFDDFERATARVARRVVLDLNDPNLLVDVRENTSGKRARLGGNFKRRGAGGLSKSLSARFNISNDEAYDALKENHQSKVRAVIGNVTLEHSMPALKLQWPYYRVKLHQREARTYHRPALKFNKFLNQPILFSKPAHRKRKHMKGLTTRQIFKESKDLTLADNSNAMLVEYSEEHPTVLSNFGMANKIINYYRRKDEDDNSRPKLDVGETSVLLPEDRSPFSQFGFVDPGETVPTLHNAMYRTPVFKQDVKSTDFLVIRSTTGVVGSEWHLRNIDHAFVTGQQLPSVEIPGPNSRKVTNAAKNRMKMIAFRKIRHNPAHTVKIDEITAHIADSSDMQNRQKLKEFIKYHKDEKVWRMKPGDIMPDEATVRSWVKPEDVCTIDAMQVGLRHLEDAGYAGEPLGDEDEEEEQQGNSLEEQLAPWKTTKNFLDASAGKAMLKLHGDGDPSGCGMAFNFIKTSMKGGYLETVAGPQATSADAIARERKANGGHKYNVDKQSEAYNAAIRDIWERQKKNLSEMKVLEYDPEGHPEDSVMEDTYGVAATPHSATTPALFDDTASQMSRFSTASRQGKSMRIVRQVRNKQGIVVPEFEVVKDHKVWREYQKRRHARDADAMNVYEAKPTGDAEFDKKEALRIKKELARLERNKERRHAREKQKGIFRPSAERDTADPGSTPAPTEKPVGTTRKCANCGQAGHIKTNKKLCPMLNGTMKPEEGQADHGFGSISVSFGS